MEVALLLAAVLVAYNNALNLWPPFNGAAYIPLNALLTTVMVFVAVAGLDLSRTELGLEFDLVHAAIGIGIAVVFGSALFGLAANERTAWLVTDARVAHLRGAGLIYQTLLRIPIGTAVAEEIVFRGVLLAVLQEQFGPVTSALWSSAAFGLWHVSPTVNLVRMNHSNPTRRRMLTMVAAGVAFTTLAGLGFSWLRIETGNLTASAFVHAGVNSLGTLASVRAARRTRSLVM